MKILFVDIHDAEDLLNWSGTTANVLTELRKRHEVVLAHNLNRWPKYLYLPFVVECKLRGVKSQLDRHELIARHYAKQVHRLFLETHSDIVFSMSTIPTAYLPDSVPTVTWADAIMHDMVDYYWKSDEFHSSSMSQGRRLDAHSLSHNRASIFSSKWAADGARNVAPQYSGRIYIVPFGANNPAGRQPDAIKALPTDSLSEINLLFVGSDWKRKGGEDAVVATKILHSKGYNIKLLIVGADPVIEEDCSYFVRKYGFLRSNVEVEAVKLRDIFESAHIFVLPTRAECSPIVFAEAASFGLPVVSRDTGGVSSMVARDANSILIEPDDQPDILASRIQHLLDDPQKYEAMSVASRQLFKEKLNWPQAVAEVSNILHYVLEKHEQMHD